MVRLNRKFGFDVSYPGVGIKVDIIVMKEYLSQMNVGIAAVKNSYLKAEESNNNEWGHDEMSHIYYIEDSMPRYIRTPFLISIFSLFENSTKQLLKYAQDKEGKSLSLKDINDRDLHLKHKKYIKHVLEFDFDFDHGEIDELKNINQLRNCIAHANGNIAATDARTKSLIQRLELEDKRVEVIDQQLDISYEYLVSSLETITSLLESLMSYIEAKYNCYG